MKNYLLLIFLFIISLKLTAQDRLLSINPEQIESIFLENNLELLAAKYNIDIADAAILQARLWENPNLSISSVNLWSTRSQREGEDEVIPPLFGSFGKNTEFSIELSQLIQTANKRGKLIRREKVSKEIALQEFEEILRGLRAELRKSVHEVLYLQSYITVLNNQQASILRLIEAYKKQVQLGNLSKNELLRLQSSYLELQNEMNETGSELNLQEKTLKILLNIKPETKILITDNEKVDINPDEMILSQLIDTATDARPDLKRYKLQTQFYEKSLDYEKSQRIPDITLSGNYDRYGGVWKNFIGFGISIDLPFLNRNQGNIKAAKASISQSILLTRQHQNTIHHDIANSYDNYYRAYTFYKQIKDDSLLPELDGMLDVYAKNLLSRNISMLEYIDFLDAYRTNKQIMLHAKKNVNILFEELQYTIGTDIK